MKWNPLVIHKVIRITDKQRIPKKQKLKDLLKKAENKLDFWKRNLNEKEWDHIQSGITKLNRAADCGKYRRGDKHTCCNKPLLCDWCMQLRKGKIASTILDAITSNIPVYGAVYKHSFSFPRGIVNYASHQEVLFRATGDCSQVMSNNGFNTNRCYSDAMFDVMLNIEHHRKELADERRNRSKSSHSNNSYLGTVSILHSLPYSNKLCFMELYELVLWKKPPVRYKTFVEKHNVKSHFFNYEIEYIRQGKFKQFTIDNTQALLDKILHSDVTQLLKFTPEELMVHVGYQGSHVTFNTAGPLFRSQSPLPQKPL